MNENRNRKVKKQFWLDEYEAKMLSEKSQKACMKEGPYIRNLICGYEPREKPDDEFYEVMKELRAIGNNLNQIARKVNTLGYVDSSYYQEQAEKWCDFIVNIKERFLTLKR